VWDSAKVEVWSTISEEHVLMIHGRFIKSNETFFLFNVYAPCNNKAKEELWGSLFVRLQQLWGHNVCVCGDFNAVHVEEEKCSFRGGVVSLDAPPFNLFIEDNLLIDLPPCGRHYTWFKGDGLSMSRLDRFLLSEDW